MILQVGSNSRKVNQDRNFEALQLLLRTNAAKLQQLGRVISTAREDDLAGSLGRAGCSLASILVAWAGLVQVLPFKELNSSSTRLVTGFVKCNLGDVGVELDVQRVLLGAVLVHGITNGYDEFAGTDTRMVLGADGHLVVRLGGVSGFVVAVGITKE